MSRYFLEISYRGTAYHGWQIQSNANSVQAEIDKVLSSIFSNRKIETTGCGRTDTGVHAEQFFLHADFPEEVTSNADFIHKLNRMLPGDIAVHEIYQVAENAHARFDASSRSYEYRISKKKNPFKQDLTFLLHADLNIKLMNEAAEKLISTNDFAAFCKTGAQNKTTICKVTEASWIQLDNELIFKISADRFLRNMVRAIVGTLIQVGKSQITIQEFEQIISGKNRSDAGESVSASGLFLTRVTYAYIRAPKS